jgi:aminopeptidase N
VRPGKLATFIIRVGLPATVLLCNRTASNAQPISPSGDFKVFGYDLEIEIDRDRKVIAGRERIRLRSGVDGLAVIAFPQNGIKVRTVALGSGAPVPYVDARGEIEVRLPAGLARDQQIAITLEYEAIEPKGVVFSPDYVYTFFHTCHWMVCRDRPDDKATLTLSLTVPEGQTAIASGVLVDKRSLGKAMSRQVWKKRWKERWEERVPSSPYLFGFAIGSFRAPSAGIRA